ncbi:MULTISPECIES: ABC transporter substrate-binding protein [Streptomyces]|uniref:ABC transporter substrate-binding protein n=1 Tax=Streptomyces koelreuteriae TaxID=2838015 RepID=A0ABX8FV32_9ACTN|nr:MULTISPECIES: ABC transporter substrate-binding protein [Streptomyces]QWB24916.1 ABC transporter substrate-binding protein [Streptomyces koelreuteriae]UUA07935.1 ABC transporter substrate-binding protein [Streptomyces koelreuteriae]UUA15563.1 ABC transporter substrate-binding protein [Streptomyces sp. CRCS-T-1]
MTGRRRTRSTFLPGHLTRHARKGVLRAGTAAACASILAGCGVVPGTTGDAGDDPITVMTWAPQDTKATNKPGMPAFAHAYARWINAKGGINGRKLNVLTCNDHNDSVAAAKCARRAAKENVVAVVGSYSQYADSFFPSLEGAGIPYIGGYGITNAEFTSPLSYPVNGGQPALLAGLGRSLAGCGPVALVRPDTIAGDQLPPLLDSGLKAGGHSAARDQRAPEDATEYDGHAERALETTTSSPGDEGCVVPALGDRNGTFMDSFRRTREDYPDVRTATVLGSVDQTVIDATGGASGPYEGSYITGWYPVASDARWDGMKRVIKEEAFGDNRIDAADAGVQTTWIAYTVFKKVVESLGGGEVSADTVTEALDDGLGVNTGGLTPTLRWRFQDKLAAVGFPRLVNANVTLQVVREGRLVSARKGFVDTTRTLQDADVNY